MSRQYNNFCKRLAEYDATILTSEKEYTFDKETNQYPEFLIVCKNGHSFSIKVTSLSNKIAKLRKEPGEICAECEKPEISGEEQQARDRCAQLGFKFVSYQNRNIEYKCVCGNITTTHASNLLREKRKADCPKCQNKPFRTLQTTVQKYFREQGCKLLSEYTSRQKPVKYRCACGAIDRIRSSDFKRGKRCQACKPVKYKQTCQEKYGVDNLFQLDATKEKSKKTCMKKYGVEYCMQSPAIFKKAMSTSYHRKITVKQEGHIWIVQGYEPHCINDLLEEFEPSDIIAGEGAEVPVCTYQFNGKERTWYPDVYLPTVDKIIEVKSTWTYTRCPEQIKEKITQCPYDCELRVYNRDGSIFELVYRNSGGPIMYYYGDKFVLGKPIKHTR